MAAAVAEAQPGTRHEVLYGARYENLAWTGKCRNARASMNGNVTDIVSDHLAFAGMEPGTNLDAEWLDLLGNGTSTANSASRTVKCSKKAVTRRFDLMAAKARKITPDRGVMFVEQIAPPLSPSAAALSVEPTMSVNRTVARMRSTATGALEKNLAAVRV